MSSEREKVDRAAIFSNILQRNALRREAKLPLLNVRAVCDREVEHARWRAYVEQHLDQTRSRIAAEFEQRVGREPLSGGALMAIAALTLKSLRQGFRAQS